MRWCPDERQIVEQTSVYLLPGTYVLAMVLTELRYVYLAMDRTLGPLAFGFRSFDRAGKVITRVKRLLDSVNDCSI